MEAEYGKLFVVLMGIGTVFFGLICIIFLTMAMGKVMEALAAKQAAAVPAKPTQVSETRAEVKKLAQEHPQQTNDIAPGVLVAIMAALSEEPGISSRGWNITSIKKSI